MKRYWQYYCNTVILILFEILKISNQQCTENLSTDMQSLIADMFANRLTPTPYSGNFMTLASDPLTNCQFTMVTSGAVEVFGDTCLQVPVNYTLTMIIDKFSIKYTKITYIDSLSFLNWKYISELDIEMNPELITVKNRAFEGLINLSNLSISDNYALTYLQSNAFQGLTNLLELRLLRNNFAIIQPITLACRPAMLPNIIFIDLSENMIGNLKNDDFSSMKNSSLELLCLTMCNIRNVETFTFAPLTNLIGIRLGKNFLTINSAMEFIDGLRLNNTNLKELSISENFIAIPTILLECISNTTVTYLDISSNHLDSLYPGFFPFMPRIQYLDLSNIMVYNLPANTLTSSLMPNLKKLNLSKNRFSGFLESLSQLSISYLDLSDNSADPYWSSLFYIKDYSFLNMTYLQTLILSENMIFHIHEHMFDGLVNLEILLLQNCSVTEIDDYAFRSTPNLQFLDLSDNSFSAGLTGRQLSFLDKLISLDLSNSQIQNIQDPAMLSNMTNLQYLNLKDNFLIEIKSSYFDNLVCLHHLDLGYNYLIIYDEPIFVNCVNLKVLNLKSNSLTLLTKQMLSDFLNLEFLDLRNNPITCDCFLVRIINNFVTSRNVCLNNLPLNITSNYCFSPNSELGILIMNYITYAIDNNLCFEVGIEFIMAMTILTIGLFGIILWFFLYYFRWHIRYWLFLFRESIGYKHFPKRQNSSNIDSDFKYDAFVSYSNEDRSFVVRLVAMLENYEPFLNLCVFERDFNIGDIISETVINNVATSRKTILVLTDSYAKSQWCLWEAHIAEHSRIFYKSSINNEIGDPLIIIKLGEIMDCHLTPTLKYLIRTRIYLKWHKDAKRQLVFWSKLRSVLRPIKKNKNK